jgi:hypothetical protein
MSGSTLLARRSPSQNYEAERAEPDLVAVGQRRRLHLLAVNVGGIKAAEGHNLALPAGS